MYRYKITVEYLGTNFCGWQRQKNALSIQELIEAAIDQFSREKVVVWAAGRTDAGVHAYGQVAHFDLSKLYDPTRVMGAINHFRGKHDIGVTSCCLVDQDFHARFSARQRHYVYKILNRPGINIINAHTQYWLRDKLDISNMQQGANYLIGKHDFSAFRSSECQSSSPIKTLSDISIVQIGDEIQIYCSALSFLHHMVRNIVGSLLLVGKGQWLAENIQVILASKDRRQAGPMAAAQGLYFLRVDY